MEPIPGKGCFFFLSSHMEALTVFQQITGTTPDIGGCLFSSKMIVFPYRLFSQGTVHIGHEIVAAIIYGKVYLSTVGNNVNPETIIVTNASPVSMRYSFNSGGGSAKITISDSKDSITLSKDLMGSMICLCA